MRESGLRLFVIELRLHRSSLSAVCFINGESSATASNGTMQLHIHRLVYIYLFIYLFIMVMLNVWKKKIQTIK